MPHPMNAPTTNGQRPLPQPLNAAMYDEDMERAVLGTLMARSYAYAEVCDRLDAGLFTTPATSDAYAAIVALQGRGEPFDTLHVTAEARRNGSKATAVDFAGMLAVATTSSDLLPDVLRLRELSMRRRAWELCTRAAQDCCDPAIDVADTLTTAKSGLDAITADGPGSGVVTVAEATRELLRRVQDNINGTAAAGIPTGFHDIDRRGGLQPGNLVVIAAETSMGKTSFAQAVAVSAARSGAAVAFYSMEMTNVEVTARLFAAEAKIPVSRLLYEAIGDSELQRLMLCSPAGAGEMYFDDRSSASLGSILSSIQALRTRYGIAVAIVDYLQILGVNARAANKEQQMAEAARLLKNAAKDAGVCVVAVSQLNRNAENPLPTLARLRDSGQIAEAADQVILIYRAEYYQGRRAYPEPFDKYSIHGTAMVDVAKGRNTGTFRFLVGFDAATTRFFDYPSKHDYPLAEPGGKAADPIAELSGNGDDPDDDTPY